MKYHIAIRQTGNSYYVFMLSFSRMEYTALHCILGSISINQLTTLPLCTENHCALYSVVVHSVDLPV